MNKEIEKEFLTKTINHVVNEVGNVSKDDGQFIRLMTRLGISLVATICMHSNNKYKTLLNLTGLVKEYMVKRRINKECIEEYRNDG